MGDDGDQTVNKIVSTVGLWWPDAEEGDIRAAAAAWDAFAGAIENAHEGGRGGASQARAHWTGQASEAFGTHWAQFDRAMPQAAEGSREIAKALREYGDEVEHAKHQVEELAIEIGASIAIGTALAFFTFGATEVAADGIAAGLIARAAAIGVQLSARAAAIGGRMAVGAAFGAVTGLGGDAVGQVARVEGFGDGGYSLSELGTATAFGAGSGALLGGASGVLGKLGRIRGGRAPEIGGEEPPVSGLRPGETPEPGAPAPGSEPGAPMSAADRTAFGKHLDDVAARNPEKYDRLRSNDPDHVGKTGTSQENEAKIALDMSERGRWGAGVERPDAPGKGDFHDPGPDGGTHWDVKGYHSDYPDHVPMENRLHPYRNAVTPQKFTEDMEGMFGKNLNVLLDSRNLDAKSIDFMQRIIEEKGWQGRVQWYP